MAFTFVSSIPTVAVDHSTATQFSQHLSDYLRPAAVLAKRHQESLQSSIATVEQQRAALLKRTELQTMAQGLLRELVATASEANIKRVENLVNAALRSIFFDQPTLEFRILNSIMRNQTTYRIALYSNGVEGSIDSFGGGVWAVVAFVLKATFNLLSERYPLIVMDESLTFVSKQYLESTSAFIKDLARELNMVVILVTHQPGFAANADIVYNASPGSIVNSVQFQRIVHEDSNT